MDQLIRETQPPAGTMRSPVPQYWNPDAGKYERVLGSHGAPRAILYDPNGQPISTSNRLPVDVGGQIHADVDLGDVTVEIAEVQQGKRGQNAEPWEVTLSGHVQELTVVQGLALTDTSYTLEDIDVSMFRQWDFRVLSTLNQRVRLKLYAGSTAVFNTGFRYTYLKDDGEVSSKSLELTVPWTISGQDRIGSLGSQVPEVFHAPVNPITTLSLRILADTAPTSGSISIYIRGVKS